MRKILSIILTAAMTLSLFAAIPLGAGAEAASGSVTFDTQTEKNYYADERHTSARLTDTGDAAHGTAINFSTIGGPNTPQNNVLRIAQYGDYGKFDAYTFRPGISYTISFDYNIAVNGSNWGAIYLKLVYATSNNGASSMFWVNGSGIENWKRIDCAELPLDSNGWAQYSYSFTVDSVTELMLAPVNGPGFLTNQKFTVDNITVTAKETPTSVKLDFENEAVNTWLESHSSAQAADADEIHGKALKLTSLQAANASSVWTAALHVPAIASDGSVNGFVAKAGTTYDLSLKVKIDELPDGVELQEFYMLYSTGGVYPYANDGISSFKKTYLWNSQKTQALKDGWTTIRFNFTVPTDIGNNVQMYLFPVISSWKESCVVWLDDVSLAEMSYNNTSVDFENTDNFFNSAENYREKAVDNEG